MSDLPASYPADYYDGLSAAPNEVSIEFDRQVLRIFDAGGNRVAHWPMRRVLRSVAYDHKTTLRIRLKGYSHARLVIRDPLALKAMRDMHPRLFRQRTSFIQFFRFATTLAVFTGLLVASIYFLLPRAAGPLAAYIPAPLEVRIGNAALRALVEEAGECKGGGLTDLNLLARRLAGDSAPHRVRVHVIGHPVPNAFAIPGGKIIFTEGLIEYLDEPGELVGALAHEVGHVILRHPIKGAISQFGILFFDAFITGGISDASGVGSLLVANAYTRDFEWEADRQAIVVLNAAEVSTEGFVRLMQRFADIEAEGEGQPSDVLLRTHPFAQERADAAQVYHSSDGETGVSEAAWGRIKAVCSIY